ncbi:MAG: TonB-dependent receptor [Prevotellaceae bacterium]|nr:TonB-dependent receptor [Prevotellaceae bacterium]
MLKKRIAAVALFAMLLPVSLQAQENTVTGTVVDADGQPLVGVSVMVKGTTMGTIANANGDFSINVPPDATLVFSFVGYSSKEVEVAGKTRIRVEMNDGQYIDEVVVIGYGTARRRDITGATASVSGKDIVKIPVTTAAQAIAGKIAGVNVVSQSGAPGADINILVRGGTSITQSTTPLYIVDGFQVDDGLRNVDINDIESIDVMKDASATAIYGARGSNGVILITTKSGREGRTQVSYNTYYSFEQLNRKIDMLGIEDYAKYQYEFQILRGGESKWAEVFGGDPTNPDFYTGAYDYIAKEYGSREAIDWQELMFGGTSVTRNHNVSVTSGNEKTNFLISYNYMGQDGILAKTGYDRNSIRTKLNHKLLKNVRLETGIGLNTTYVEGGGSLSGLRNTAMQPPTGGVLFTNEQMINQDNYEFMYALNGNQYDVRNPLIENDAVTRDRYTRQATANAALDVDIVSGLTWRTAASYLWQHTRNDSWTDGRAQQAKANSGPFGSRNNSEKYTWQVTNTLSYKKTLADVHNLNLVAGQETWFSESMRLDNTYKKFPEDNFKLNNTGMSDAAARETGSGLSRVGLVSAFGRVMYNYDDRYLVSATLRGDGSSKFEQGSKWGMLPSASAGWRISEESFMKDNVSFVDNLKLRAGYGVTGNCDIDNNMYATGYGGGKYGVGAAELTTLAPQSELGNPNLVWEQTTSLSVGIDVSLLSNRINLTLEWYDNTSDNLLIKKPIAKSSGYSTQFQNVGSIRNRGYEFILNTVNVKTDGGFVWRSDLNMSFNKSKILSLDRPPYTVEAGDGNMRFLVQEGDPLGQFWGLKYAGIYTTDDFEQIADDIYRLKDGVPRKSGLTASQVNAIKPGDIMFECVNGNTDENGNPVWTDSDEWAGGDRTVLGSAMPLFYGGLNNSVMYKGFDLSMFMNFSYGNKVFNMNTQRYAGPRNANENASAAMANRFTLIDPATGKETFDLDRLATLNPNQHDSKALWSLHNDNKDPGTVNATDYNMEDGSYLRISTITLGYTLPKSLMQKVYISSLRVYCTVNNPYTFTRYSGYDPDVSTSGSILTRGLDNSAYPRTRSWVVGLNLSF